MKATRHNGRSGKHGTYDAMVVVVLFVIGGAAGGYFFLTKSKNKKSVNNGFDPDADYNEDEENYLDSIPDDEDDIDDAVEESGDVSSEDGE